MVFAPLAQADDDGKQRLAFFRQYVFLVGAAVGRRHGRQDVVRDQGAQAVAEDVLGHAEAFLEFTEAAHAVEGVAHDQ